MKDNWKEPLIVELNAYISNVQNFKKKWDKNIVKLLETLKERYIVENKKREDLYDNVINKIDKLIKDCQSQEDRNNCKSLLKKIKLEKDNADSKLLTNYATKEELELLSEYIKDCMCLVINSQEKILYDKYKFLLQVLFIVGEIIRFNSFKSFSSIRSLLENCKLDDTFSEECKNLFQKILNYNALNDALNKNSNENVMKILDFNILSKDIVIRKEESYKIMYDKEATNNFYLLNISFVKKLLEEIQNDKYKSLLDICSYISNKLNITLHEDFYKLKNLYEQTYEEVLVSDQKYFMQQKLKEAREQAEMAREEQQRLERERTEMLRREAEKQAEEQKRMYERQKNDNDLQRELEKQRYYNSQLKNSNQNLNNNSNQTAKAVYDAQIAQLNAELFNLHGPNDGNRRIAVESAIRDLEHKRKNLK